MTRTRRTAEALEALATAILTIGMTFQPLTLRQLFYRMFAAGHIAKTDADYRAVMRTAKRLREEGVMPWGWLLDNMRTSRGRSRWASPEDAIASLARQYRRDLMAPQPWNVQVWAESDSAASIIWDAVDAYGIRTYVGRGHSSRKFIHDAAEDAIEADKVGMSTVVLHVGDYDPSGEDIYRDLRDTMRDYSALPIEFVRVAVLPEHVTAYSLPSAPPKTGNVMDRRGAAWTGGNTVEVEAFLTPDLLTLVRSAIEDYVDMDLMAEERAAEEADRSRLLEMAGAAEGDDEGGVEG